VSGFDKLLQLFDFADKYRGKYDSSITVAQKYYRSISGYNVSVSGSFVDQYKNSIIA